MSPSPFMTKRTINIDVAEECRWRSSSAKSYPFTLAADADEDKLIPLLFGGVGTVRRPSSAHRRLVCGTMRDFPPSVATVVING